MNIKNKIEKISPSLNEFVLKTPNKNKKTTIILLESLTRLAYSLYVLKKYSLTNELLDILTEIPFNNDFDSWTWIEYALSLKSRMSREKEELAESSEAIRKIIIATETGNELEISIKHRVFQRMLKGENIFLDGLHEAIDSKDKVMEYNERILYLMEIIKIDEIKKEIEKSNKQGNTEIEKQISACKDIINLIGIEKTMPFK
ncbi:hypothetical protein EDC48_1153 [Gibbsiella quercinecans]|uniref:Uncharacterized protein n=1 Tax=Gibbsiella quercinecans TaxID=929813 RepID=A0A250B6G7_9GAMM|nr:DUF6707 family protein [Gibbsiella quercinecans]ATA21764.1 hypothetical protein AWC35_21855 [Gibbsiella quercinecans]RLM08272.1 hypothetical protein BIY30_13635 [Gibbsiella quercinecans]TCT85245.1 hypothetical protein EDC48_1153 [Gibbsiella quercinecans]